MNLNVKVILDKYSNEIQDKYLELQMLIMGSVDDAVVERLWARLPSYYVGDNFVRLIPFKTHINVEAKFIIQHKDDLDGYTITPKGMLQIFPNQDIPTNTLAKIFEKTLKDN